MDGGHSMTACAVTTEAVLRALFDALAEQGVALEAVILKTNMILAGAASPERPTTAEVAERTRGVLRRVVPAEVPGVAFLSGGQSGELASARLNSMNAPPSPNTATPWTLTFSFARAIQQPAREIWAGLDANKQQAQATLLHRARCNRFAHEGRYTLVTETSRS
jgi:fructose-bisphosphate aldolase class I